MQSGISVTAELHSAFTTFTSDPSHFCLPVTITSESLTPQDPIRFDDTTNGNGNGTNGNAFYQSLPHLSPLLEPKTPIYLILRRPQSSSSTTGGVSLLAVTYIPSDAPVRSKTLFASTRATLVRELGSEKFEGTVFATEEEEVVSERAWRERDADKKRDVVGGANEGGGGDGISREDLMGDKERELEAVRRAVEEARSGTPGRDIGIGGSFAGKGNGGTGSGRGTPAGGGGIGIQMPMDEDARGALGDLQAGGLVQLAIDIPTETLKLSASESSVDPDSVGSHISPSSPRYTFYHYPDSDAVMFIYTCPSGSSIKERMLYASSRANVINTAGDQGLKISKKIEGSSPDEVTGARLNEEVNPPVDEGPKRGFARPRRPGR